MIYHGDLFDVLPTLPAESIDAGVTDPPYGIGFMGKKWDTFSPADAKRPRRKADHHESKIVSTNPNTNGRWRSPALSPSLIDYDRSVNGQREFQAWTERWSAEVHRVLKPGAYLLVFGAPRSYHRMACGLEDAGFEIRDMFSWLFGQGYPKSLDVARAVDMALCLLPGRHCMRELPREADRKPDDHVCESTELGQRWAGYGSGLKPGQEPIAIARKPLSGTLAENVFRYGAGALNIDACRAAGEPWDRPAQDGPRHAVTDYRHKQVDQKSNDLGRWPANVLLDELAAAVLDEQSGELASGHNPTSRKSAKFGSIYEGWPSGQENVVPARGADSGGASRFFYVAKPSRDERDMGCHDIEPQPRDESRKAGNPGGDNPRNRGLQPRGNNHPTVKPIALMRWLVRLVTPQNGRVLDPFVGSGTTGMACVYEQREFIGIEREAEYVEIARNRIAAVAPLFASEVPA